MAVALKLCIASMLVVMAGATTRERLIDNVALGVTGRAAGTQADEAFEEYIIAQGREYSKLSAEYEWRRLIFHQRLATIEAHNANGGRLWTATINGLTDRTQEELAMLHGWRRTGGRDAADAHGATRRMALLEEGEGVQHLQSLSTEVDWRSLAMASRVPQQGHCGSCWAVATASMLEGRLEKQLGVTNRTFSAQQLLNCVPNPRECGGTGGCKGATVELAMEYVELMGLVDELIEPYVAKAFECKRPLPASTVSSLFAPSLRGRAADAGVGMHALPRSWRVLDSNKALPLMSALIDGPVAVSVAGHDWHSYGDGIFDGCSKDAVVSHAVVAFGYGRADGVNFWTIRNSWGESWGEKGFIRLLRQDTPEEEEAWCGRDDKPEAGIACKPYPESVKVCGMCAILYDSVVANF